MFYTSWATLMLVFHCFHSLLWMLICKYYDADWFVFSPFVVQAWPLLQISIISGQPMQDLVVGMVGMWFRLKMSISVLFWGSPFALIFCWQIRICWKLVMEAWLIRNIAVILAYGLWWRFLRHFFSLSWLCDEILIQLIYFILCCTL